MIIQPRIWHICNNFHKCGEYFYYPNKAPKICPDCKKGILIKSCVYCGKPLQKCKCSKEFLDSKCHNCGFTKEKCKCKK